MVDKYTKAVHTYTHSPLYEEKRYQMLKRINIQTRSYLYIRLPLYKMKRVFQGSKSYPKHTATPLDIWRQTEMDFIFQMRYCTNAICGRIKA